MVNWLYIDNVKICFVSIPLIIFNIKMSQQLFDWDILKQLLQVSFVFQPHQMRRKFDCQFSTVPHLSISSYAYWMKLPKVFHPQITTTVTYISASSLALLQCTYLIIDLDIVSWHCTDTRFKRLKFYFVLSLNGLPQQTTSFSCVRIYSGRISYFTYLDRPCFSTKHPV